MTVKLKKVADQVIVITGASSGIGLATAEMAVERGARIVMAARSEDELREVVQRLNRNGKRATYIAADVSDEAAVQRIADKAIAEFGGFDTWVNNAGVIRVRAAGRRPDDDHRRLFETNFWGVVYGSLAAVRHLQQPRRRAHQHRERSSRTARSRSRACTAHQARGEGVHRRAADGARGRTTSRSR